MNKNHIKKAKKIIKSKLESEVSLSDIAEEVGYSKYHFAREFKQYTGISVMSYVRNKKLEAASKEIINGRNIMNVAIKYGFETHAGFTKAFIDVFACGPRQYRIHENNTGFERRVINMEDIKVRPICKEDVNDLWENVYSGMTPKEIMEIKIIPSIKGYEKQEIIHLVAEVEGTVVGVLYLWRFHKAHVFGHLFDEVVHPSYSFSGVMSKLLEGMVKHANKIGISTIEYHTYENDDKGPVFDDFGFNKVFTSGGYEYRMLSI